MRPRPGEVVDMQELAKRCLGYPASRFVACPTCHGERYLPGWFSPYYGNVEQGGRTCGRCHGSGTVEVRAK